MLLGHHITSDSGHFREFADRIAAYEQAGLDAVWVSEAYGIDAVSRLGYLAARTERVLLGSGILPIYSRTPALLAQTAAGLDYVSNGRAILGLGASGPQVIEGWHGVRYDKQLGRTREIVDVCRRIWRREVIQHQGASYTMPLPPEQGTGLGKPLKIIGQPVRSRIPIYLATLGPKAVEMTAEIAEGWMPIFFWPERADGLWGEALRRGLAKRDPELGSLEIVAGGLAAVGERLEHLRDQERPHLALYIGGMGARGANFYNDLARDYGCPDEARLIQDLYLDGKKAEAAAAVPEPLLEGTTLIGPDSYIRDRLAAYKAAGVTMLNVTPVGPDDPARTIAHLKELAATS
ncbi:MAG TPA: LLM class F420-dependent oxidoreductase [Chloroflexota bacterium]|nr:LLM class F420-dependent oxidoreductase [Chloroflexota bacterium]